MTIKELEIKCKKHGIEIAQVFCNAKSGQNITGAVAYRDVGCDDNDRLEVFLYHEGSFRKYDIWEISAEDLREHSDMVFKLLSRERTGRYTEL